MMEQLKNGGSVKVADSRQVLDTRGVVYVRKSAHLWNTQPETHDTISYMTSHFGLNFPLSGQELRGASELG